MRLKLTILLALLNAALLTTIVVIERDKTGQDSAEDSRLVLSPGLVDKTDKIEIEGGAIIGSWVMQKSNNQWFITNPVRWTANSFAIRRILSTLKNLDSATKFPVSTLEKAGRSLADYGLDDPKTIIKLHHDGLETAIKLGESVEIGNRIYILSPDESYVCVIERDILSNISLDLGTLSDQNIFNIPLFETRSINMQYGNLKMRVARNDTSSWIIESPIQARADATRVETALKGLLQTQIQSFEETALANQGLVNPKIRITIEGNNRRQTILVGNQITSQTGELVYYAQLTEHPTIFTIEAAPLDALRTAQEDLRDSKFVRFNPESLSALEISQKDINISLKRLETGNWRIMQHDVKDGLQSMPADPILLQGIITRLLTLNADRFYSDAPSTSDLDAFGFNDPQRTVSIQAESTLVLLLGNYDTKNGLVFAKIQDKPFVYQINSDLLFALKLNPLNYRNRVLQELPPSAQITHFKLVDLEKSGKTILDYTIDPGSGTWAQVWVEAPDQEKNALRVLVTYLRRFKVREFIRDDFDPGYYTLDESNQLPWKFRLDTTLKLPAGDEDKESSYSLYFTERMGGSTQFGGSPDHKVVFTNTEDLIESLFLFTRDITKPDEIPVPNVPEDLGAINDSQATDQPGE